MEKERFQEEYAPVIPTVSGVYRYYDKKNKLLYVGKAKNLRNRIQSYFSGKQILKTARLVSLIDKIEWTVTPSEHDAFLMENSLIKHFKPPYNIDLKDDKSYPYIVIKNEAFPRIYLTRRRIKDGSEYLGPFTNVKRVRSLLGIIKKYIPLRSCNLNLNPEEIAKGKYKVCLDYHIKKCKGPCEGYQSIDDYQENVNLIKQILRGNLSALIQKLEADRDQATSDLAFEQAQRYQHQIEEVSQYRNKNSVVSNGFYHLDIISAIDGQDVMYINYMMVEEGQIIQSESITIEKKLEELVEDVLAHALIYFRQRFKSEAKEIVSSHSILIDKDALTLTIPKAGPKKKFLELSEKNAYYFQLQEEKKLGLAHLEKASKGSLAILHEVKDKLHLDYLPLHIECFDNSNLQGSSPVSAMVYFKNGEPSKKDYRHFHIKTVEGIDDYASMREVIYRRYNRVLIEKLALPDLIIVDGGKGQLSAALDSLTKLDIADKVSVIALAEKEERIFKAGRKDPILLPYNSDALLFLRRIRDEVHDYGLGFHRRVRSKKTFQNELEKIPGIGSSSAQKLLNHFRSVKQVQKGNFDDLSKIVGPQRAQQILDYFKQKPT